MLVFALLVLSAYLRLRAAGFGCADWPACYGRLPVAAAPWWATIAHRAVATVLGVLILAMALTAWRQGGRRERLTTLTLFVLTLALAALGLQTPAPTRPWVTLGNVAGAMAMLALLMMLVVPSAPPPAASRRGLRPWAALGLALLFVQIALGAWVSANFAAAACFGLRGCGAEVWESAMWNAFDLARDLSVVDGVIRPATAAPLIHMAHRLGGLAAFFYLGALGLLAARHTAARRSALALLVVLLLQITLGIAMVALGLPLALAVAHNAAAVWLLGTAVRFYSCLK